MEKIIGNTLYNTDSMKQIASWKKTTETHSEILYFSDNAKYLLHCEGQDAQLSNAYGTESFGQEDLFLLDMEDLVGWLDVHSPKSLQALFPQEDFQKDTTAVV